MPQADFFNPRPGRIPCANQSAQRSARFYFQSALALAALAGPAFSALAASPAAAAPPATATVAPATPGVAASAAKSAELHKPEAVPAPLLVRIGHAAPLSGAIAFLGQDEENGVRLAIETLNARKLKIGGRPVQWQLEASDDAGEPAKAVAQAEKFCASKVNAVVGHMQSSTTLPAARIYNECGIPNITPAAGSPAITQAGYEASFRVIADDRAQMQKLIADAASRLGVKRLAIIDDGSAYGQLLMEWLQEAAVNNEDVDVVATLPLNAAPVIAGKPQEPDFGPSLRALNALKGKHKPDAVFFAGLDTQTASLLTQLGVAAKTMPALAQLKLLGGDAMCTNRLPELAGKQPLLKNIRCVQAGVPLEDLRDAAQWKQRYSKQFPKAAQLFSPYAYDATMVLAKAMMEADSAQPQAFLPYLRRVEYQGYTGKISFTAQGDLQEPVVTVYEYADGERKAVEPVAVAAPAAPAVPLAPEAAKQRTAAGADK